MEKEVNKKAEEYNSLFKRAYTSDHNWRIERKDWEEFYYNDLAQTMTQFDPKQKEEIRDTYAIPISTKYQYPIMEQLVSFLTGLKPYPRLVSASANVEEFVQTMHKCYQGVFYESKTDNLIRQTLMDQFNTGIGWLRVRKNNFYNESTFGVVHENVPWYKVWIDPDCEKEDLSDANYVIVAEIMPKEKAERILDMKIPDDAVIKDSEWAMDDIAFQYYSLDTMSYPGAKKREYVWFKEYFIRDQVNVYISDKGLVTTKRPSITEIKNPVIMELEMKIMEVKNAIQTGNQARIELQNSQSAIRDDQKSSTNVENFQDSENNMVQIAGQETDTTGRLKQLEDELQQLTIQKKSLPKMVTAYVFKNDDNEESISLSVSKIMKKLVKNVVMVGDYIIDEDREPSEAFPLINLVFLFKHKVRICYGLTHMIGDLVMGMNKLIGLTLYDLSLNPAGRVMYAQGTIAKPTQMESNFAQPGGAIEYIPDPSLPNSGEPKIIQQNTLNTTITFLLDKFLQLIEYITGIYGVVQGNPESAPDTLGATQSMQSFGTQRVKLYARNMEYPLQQLAYVTVCYLRKYVERNKMLTYFDDNDNPQNIEVLDDPEDLHFKVRVEISKSLPTMREMLSRLLGQVSSQTQNPYVADMLTQYMLKILDFPEGKVMAEKIDVIKQMEQNIQQLQEELDTQTKRNKALENNLYQKDVSQQTDKELYQAKADIDKEKALAIQQVQNGANNAVQTTTSSNNQEINENIY